MTKKHFFAELTELKALAEQFAEANPALAPLLEGPMADPDVERLLDAVVFQNGLLGKKLDADFHTLVRNLAQLILPHYMRPFPANTILGFTPAPGMARSVTIPSGALIDSIPVDGTCCRFRISRELEVHPLQLTDVAAMQSGERTAEIRLSFVLCGLSLAQWRTESLRFFLGGDSFTAGELYRILCSRLQGIVLSGTGSGVVNLPPECLRPCGYEKNEALTPYPPNAFSGYRLFQEYSNAPEKFLFFDLTGMEHWGDRGDDAHFSVSLQLDALDCHIPKVGLATFVLNAVPAVNLFFHEADPVFMDYHASRSLVRPCGVNPDHYRIFSVDRVTGFSRETGREMIYTPFDLLDTDISREPVYHVDFAKSPDRDDCDAYLSMWFPDGATLPVAETLSLELTCSNGVLPESLKIGDICIPVSGIPEGISCRSITPVNPGDPLSPGRDLLWQLTTHLYLNHATLKSIEHLSALLGLYLLRDGSSEDSMSINRRRISGLENMEVAPAESMVSGVPLRGNDIRLKVHRDHFAGSGDLYLFGCVLDHFFAEYVEINGFTRLTVDELVGGERYLWPIRQE